MKLDFKTAFKAAQVPALALIATTIIGVAFSLLGAGNISIPLLPIQLAILGYTGYSCVKAYKMDIANGALAGAMASFLSMIFTGIVSFQDFSNSPSLRAGYADAGIPSDIITVLALAFVFVSLLFSLGIGIVFGAIGAYIAKKK